jgi:hypothetical protein
MQTLNDVEDKNILSEIFDNEIIVYEDVQGSKIWVNWNGKEFTIKPKRLSNDPINLVDLAMQNFYNPAMNYFETMDDRVKGLMPRKWWFCFEYFPDPQPANIEYSRVPKHGLVLTSVNKNGKYDYSLDEILEYSRLFDVDHLPIVFQGHLSDDMKQGIEYFVNTSEDDLEYVFGEKNFSFFFYNMLNPSTDGSFLMDGDFQDNVEKLIFRINGKEKSFQILNPLYKRVSQDNNTDFVEIYTLILLNFLTFCQGIDIDSMKLKGDSREEMYIYLMCKLFNMYVSDVKEDLLNFEFTLPEFWTQDKFKINRELISNKLTNEIIEESDKLEYYFKIVLSSFNKKRKKPIGIFTENTVKLFNGFVDRLDILVDKELKMIRDIHLSQSGLVDFGSFVDFEVDVDSQGKTYPSVWDEIESTRDNKKKKKMIPTKKKKDGGDFSEFGI